MKRLSWLFFSLAVLGMMQAPVFGQEKKDPPKMLHPPGPSFKHLDGQLLVFVANGVSSSTIVSDNLLELNGEKQLGLRITMVPWCRHDASFKDLVDSEAQLSAAARLACTVTAIRKDAPKSHIFFVGHSAGARVVLAAAEMLPPKSLDRIIVLAPAVSSTYDLTTALKTARFGIDNFWSSEDGILERAVERATTADGLKVPAAGRVGFQPAGCDKKNLDAYRNVRQYRWNENFCGSGGHNAWTLRPNMKKALVPLFFTAPVFDTLDMDVRQMPQAK